MMEKLKNIIEKIEGFINKIKPQGGWLSSKKLLMAISLAISISCWIFITVYVNADSEKTITDVPIRIDTAAINESFGLEMVAITGPESLTDGKVDVTLTGSTYQISRITMDDITVVAQTSSVNKAGEYDLSLVLSCGDRDVTAAFKNSHKSIRVWFDSIMEKTVALDKPQVTGVSVPADSGLIIGDPTGFVKTISISGPETVIDRISSVQLRAELNQELTATTTVEGSICYLAEDGIVMDPELAKYITILDYNDILAAEGVAAGAPAPSDCTISIPIRTECELKIEPVFRNVPEGFDISTLRYSLSQETIRLEGDIDVMKKYSEDGVFSLDGIDLSTVSPGQNTFVIKLNLSTAVSSLDGVSEIEVKINMNGYKEDTFTVSGDRIVLLNVDGHNVSSATESMEITVVGPSGAIEDLTEKDFTVFVDMAGDEWTTGVREKTASVIVDGNSRCWPAGSYTVKIKVD